MNKPYDRKEVEQKQNYEEQKSAMKESEKSEKGQSGVPSSGEDSKPAKD